MKLVLGLLLFISSFGFSQQLELKEIMKGDAFIGNQPFNPKWSLDSKTVYFDWNPKNEIGSRTYQYTIGTSQPIILSTSNKNDEAINYEGQEKYAVVYYTKQGNLWLYNKKLKTNQLLLQTISPISNIVRTQNEKIIYFQQNRNVYQLDTNNFSLIQLTNFKSGKEIKEEEKKETFLEKQQLELFQFVQDEKAKENWNKSKKEKTEILKPIFFQDAALDQVSGNPNGKFITFRLSTYPKATYTKVENFITSDGYTKNETARSKVSSSNLSTSIMKIYNVAKDSVYEIDFSTLSHLDVKPDYYSEYVNLKNKENFKKEIVMQNPVFSNNGMYCVVQIRSSDNKDRWLVKVNLETGKTKEFEHQHNEAWIGGPGIPSYNYGNGTLGFLQDNETIYFQSEVTGFSHLYTYNLKLDKKIQLTAGNWEVREVQLSNTENAFYITTNTNHPGNREFYKLDIGTKKMFPIATQTGANEVVVSPDEKTILVRYSYKNKPWELFIGENKPNAKLTQITNSTTKEFQAYSWKDPEVISFKATDGRFVNARIYEPKVANKNKAAIIFVHGAGYLQNAHNYWSSYHREFMFHNLLTDLGYTVLDIDYRASDGYGEAFRTGIYRHMGGLDLSDQIDGKKYLVEKYSIDTNRVGIYGGSYGGFITLMALLTKPGEFQAGAALRSVTDWAHYNQSYTSNILNFPETDPEAYKKSSPIYFANNLEDKLLLLHGMVDDNVQFQDVVRLSQRFIELGKTNWNLAVFPVEAHGFTETYSWVDEYTRILNLFNETLLEK